MSPLRQEALRLLQTVPEENLLSIIRLMRPENSSVTRKAASAIIGSLAKIDETDKYKTAKEFREERLREKYAEYFD